MPLSRNLFVIVLFITMFAAITARARETHGALDDYFETLARQNGLTTDPSAAASAIETVNQSMYFGLGIDQAEATRDPLEEFRWKPTQTNSQTYNYFIGETTVPEPESYAGSQNMFTGARSDDTQVDAFGGYIQEEKLYDPYQVFTTERTFVEPNKGVAKELERANESYWKTRD